MKLKVIKSILWFFLGAGTVVGIVWFTHSHGETSALTDNTPWGLLIGFNVIGGVALAAGGFVIACIVYIFHLDNFRIILRAAILTAFLGYIVVAVSLLFDLGLPWNIWRTLTHWNLRSPLFEVAWCVMLYLTVLLLEFSPVILEKSSFKRMLKFMKKATLPLVIFGIILSTLHQSSLGSLFLIMPYRLHPLWYSPIIPVLFFISAVGLGLMVVVFESTVSSWLYDGKYERTILAGLGKAAIFMLGGYAVITIVNLGFQDKLGLLADGSWESFLYMFELLISAVLPAILLLFCKIRNSRVGLTSCSVMVILGFVLNRMNVSSIAMVRPTGSNYFPSLIEISISLWIVSAAVLVFFFFVENFKVYEYKVVPKQKEYAQSAFDKRTGVWIRNLFYSNIKRNSLVFTIGAVLAFALLYL